MGNFPLIGSFLSSRLSLMIATAFFCSSPRAMGSSVQSGMFQVCVLTLCGPLSPGQCPSQLASGERDVTVEPGTPRHDL